jgi:two-component system sensor histidine kinase KdpD
MLDEGQQLKREGVDVVVGYFEPHGRRDTIAKAAGLEFVSRRRLSYRGTSFEEMDTESILERRPAVCLVDELAHTNVPGSERTKRWEDVRVLLDAGIDVYTTLNVQHLESLNDQVFQISGIRVRETVPDWVVKQADEVVMVDATTGALLNRLKRGDIYEPEKAQRAMENFFKESTLAALRELALRHTALELEMREDSAKVFEPVPELQAGEAAAPAPSVAKDRILIHVTAEPSTAMLIRRGRRVADFLNADCFAIYAGPHADLSHAPQNERAAVERHLNFARNLHIETRVLEGDDPAQVIVDFARRNQVTQVLLGRPHFTWWTLYLGTNVVMRVIRKARDVRVTIVAERKPKH